MISHDEYVQVIKQTFITIGRKVAIKRLVGLFPIFANPILNPIVLYFVEMIVVALATEGEMDAFFLYIDMRVGKQSEKFEEAAYENYRVQQSGTKQEKLNAENKLRAEFDSFVRLTS